MGIRYKLLLSVLAAVIAVFSALWAASYFTSKDILLGRIKARAEGLRSEPGKGSTFTVSLPVV